MKSNKTKIMAASPRPAAVVAVGKAVPEFSAMSSSGQLVSLSALKGKKVILYFYPKDDTPGCTLQGQEFNQHLKDFADANTKIYGISRDSVESHCKFIDKYGYQFELLSDADEKICNLFGVIKEKNMYGNILMGIERSTFAIDENGVLMAEFRKVQAAGNAQQMLQLIREKNT